MSASPCLFKEFPADTFSHDAGMDTFSVKQTWRGKRRFCSSDSARDMPRYSSSPSISNLKTARLISTIAAARHTMKSILIIFFIGPYSMIIFDNSYTMRFPSADPHEVRKLQANVLLPMACETLGEQGQNRWFMAGGDCRVSFDIAKAADVRRLERRIAQVDLSSLRTWNGGFQHRTVYIVEGEELLRRAATLADRDGSSSHWRHYFFEAQDEAINELREQAVALGIEGFEIGHDTRTIRYDMRVPCFFNRDTDMAKFRVAFC